MILLPLEVEFTTCGETLGGSSVDISYFALVRGTSTHAEVNRCVTEIVAH